MLEIVVSAALFFILVSFLVLLLLGILVIFRRFTSAGDRGEGQVRRELIRAFHSPQYHLMNNITLPFGDGTTQIDHILVSTKGMFVIETKNYSGWIFADAKSSHWTQVIYRLKNKFSNPLRQNYRHVKAIQKLLDFVPKEQIHSVVVFTGDAVFKTEIPENVLKLKQLAGHIQGFQEDVLTLNRMQFCVGRIECVRYQISKQTDVDHQAYLKRKFNDA